MRVVALGKKNYLFAQASQSAENLAGLYAVISTCEACGVNPTDYIQGKVRGMLPVKKVVVWSAEAPMPV